MLTVKVRSWFKVNKVQSFFFINFTLISQLFILLEILLIHVIIRTLYYSSMRIYSIFVFIV